MAQHLGMLSNIKSLISISEGNYLEGIKYLQMQEKGKYPHPSCLTNKLQDDISKND